MVRQCVDDLEAVLKAYCYPLTRHTAMAVRLATQWSEAYALCTVAEPESIMLIDGSPMMVDRDVDDIPDREPTRKPTGPQRVGFLYSAWSKPLPAVYSP